MTPMTLHRRLAFSSYLGLLAIVIAWELLAAPATPLPRLFWVGVKALPLLLPLYWLARASAYAHVLAALLVLLYFCDGVALLYGGIKVGGPAALGFGAAEIAAALAFIASSSFYARFSLRAAARAAG
ncbi:MAG: DUF2069 domain-containing protein [Gammaproteobacteria bacterium]|nr:DUF2069 domain-containing protein [Gammaproteobacteria bacterium]